MSTSLVKDVIHHVIASKLLDVDNFVVDWIHNNIYWSDAHRMTISSTNIGKVFYW